ncbi:hypothetical protein [Lignipirellula cremea]|uniref:Uncharacterized protein n=1 Tax=Lignipirellula cremea TaxID=2528010 RepID=A0A518E3D4_9BACT|nr:hypothetical protein [Lignipirellula cremea]QDU98605.1 hypothetical protein Pla8534_64760 [Lignipirellula cremea]
MTEKQTEARLTSLVRDLPLPDGSTRPVRLLQFQWASYDYAIAHLGFTPLDFTAWAKDEEQYFGVNFDEAIQVGVDYVLQKWREHLDELEKLAAGGLTPEQEQALIESFDRLRAEMRARSGKDSNGVRGTDR